MIEQVVIVNISKVMDFATYHSGVYKKISTQYANLLDKLRSITSINEVLDDNDLMNSIIEARKTYFNLIFYNAAHALAMIVKTGDIFTLDKLDEDPSSNEPIDFNCIRVYQLDRKINLPLYDNANYSLNEIKILINNNVHSWSDISQLFIKPNRIELTEYEQSITMLSFENSIGCIKIDFNDSPERRQIIIVSNSLHSKIKSLSQLQEDLPFDDTKWKVIEFNYKYNTNIEKIYQCDFGPLGRSIEYAK